jgi:hypothetical protein
MVVMLSVHCSVLEMNSASHQNYKLIVVGGIGSGSYLPDTKVVVEADDSTAVGKAFDHWGGPDSALVAADADSASTLLMPSRPASIRAVYQPILYSLMVIGGSGGGSHAAKENVAISANDSTYAGRGFGHWGGSDSARVAAISDSATTIVMPSRPASICAVYRPIFYPLTIVGGSGSGIYPGGTVVTIVANDTGGGGNPFHHWAGPDGILAAQKSAATTIVTMPPRPATIIAAFNRPPAKPLVVSPANGAAGQPYVSLPLSWSCSDPDNDSLVYDVYLGKTNPPLAKVLANQRAPYTTIKFLDTSVTYYWSIVARDPQGGMTSGDIWSFTTLSPDPNDWVSVNPGDSNFLYGVTWAGNQAVAVGLNGTILTSPDCINWVRRNSGTSNNLFSAVWTGSQIVVVGDKGTILVSQDGIAWTERSWPTSGRLLTVVWTGSQCFAAGDGGLVITSADYSNWTTRNCGTSSAIKPLAWTGLGLFAVAADGTLHRSTDGQSWTTIGSVSGKGYEGFVWANNQITVAGYSVNARDSNIIFTSTDGSTWISRNAGTTLGLTSIVWNGQNYFAVGYAGAIVTSTDGIKWTWVGAGIDAWLYSVAWTGRRLVAVGGDGNTGYGAIAISP